MALVQVSSPVLKNLVHCSLAMSHSLIVGLLPPTANIPDSWLKAVIRPDPLLVSAMSGRARNEVAMVKDEFGVLV